MRSLSILLICRALGILSLLLCQTGEADDSIDFKVRIQPRADLGQFAAGDDYSNQLDLSIRRARLELFGKPTEGVFYIFAISGDRWGQRGISGGGDVAYAFVNYRLSNWADIRAGLLKLPFSRGALVSSSRILLIERTKIVSAAGAAFGPYITPHLTLHGRLKDGSVGYSLALMDGLQPGDSDSRFSGALVRASENPGMVARFEFSPAGWVEGRESDSHLGVGRHLTIAVNGAMQSGIEFDAGAEDRIVMGGDLSLHRGGLSLQTEYLRIDRDGPTDTSPSGWYLQLGHYLPRFKLEPAVRFERFDADLADGNDATTIYTGGLNWYRQGHDLKFALNLVHTRFQRGVREVADAPSRTVIELQNQLYF
jgi:hypothetical protein